MTIQTHIGISRPMVLLRQCNRLAATSSSAGARNRPSAGAARAWSPGVSRSRASDARRSPRRSIGVAPCRASAIPRRACCCSVWRRRRTAETAPGVCSRGSLGRLPLRGAVARGLRQPASSRARRDDGLRLSGAWVSAAVRCAPPANRPTPAGARPAACRGASPELELLEDVRVILCLGAFAWDAALRLPWALAGSPPVAAAAPAPALRPRLPSSPAGATMLLGLLPPEPAEHLHRSSDRGDDRCGAAARSLALGGRLRARFGASDCGRGRRRAAPV